MSDQGLSQMRDWIADQLSSALAGDGSGDFIIEQGEDLILVHVEAGTFYLISVRRARAEVVSPTERAEVG